MVKLGLPMLHLHFRLWSVQAKAIGKCFENQRYLIRWLRLSAALGLVAGIGSILLFAPSLNGIDQKPGRGIGYMPLTVTPDVGLGNPFLVGGEPRNIQMALNLVFSGSHLTTEATRQRLWTSVVNACELIQFQSDSQVCLFHQKGWRLWFAVRK
jgi:hypothetical protein